MGLIKRWLFSRKQTKPKLWPADCQCARILEVLCEGQWVGGREACIIIKSHNGARRLNQVRARLRANGVNLTHTYKQAGHNNKFKLSYIAPEDREAARKLIAVGKAL